jgi:cation diffusion facilitator family transporter
LVNTEEARLISKVAGLALVLNFLLALMKTFLSFYSGSLSITAGAIDSATDTVASLAIYMGILLSERKSRSFPLGLYKLENIASVIISIFIFIAGYEIIQHILISAPTDMNIFPLTICLLLAGTIATFLFGQYATVVGKKTGSPTLIAEGRHRQVDVLASLLVVASITLSYFDVNIFFWGLSIDRIGAVLMLFFILKTGWDLLSDGMRVLLDASIDPQTLYRVRSIINSHPRVDEIQSLTGRNAGRFRFIQASITLKTRYLEEAHDISKEIESNIRDQVPHIERVIIHYAPQIKMYTILAIPLDDEQGRISEHFGEAQYFGLVRIKLAQKIAEHVEIVENPHCLVETAKGIRVAEWLISKGAVHVAVRGKISRRGPSYVLSNAGVQLHLIRAEVIGQAINEILSEID